MPSASRLDTANSSLLLPGQSYAHTRLTSVPEDRGDGGERDPGRDRRDAERVPTPLGHACGPSMPAVRMSALTCRFAVWRVMGQRARCAPLALAWRRLRRCTSSSAYTRSSGSRATVDLPAMRDAQHENTQDLILDPHHDAPVADPVAPKRRRLREGARGSPGPLEGDRLSIGSIEPLPGASAGTASSGLFHWSAARRGRASTR